MTTSFCSSNQDRIHGTRCPFLLATIVLSLAVVRALLPGSDLPTSVSSTSLLIATTLMLIGLGFSLCHLGAPRRAPTAIKNFRSSWLTQSQNLTPL